MKNKSSFASMDEPDRMLFIANLHHYIWYDESCYKELSKLVSTWNTKKIPPANLFPKTKIESNEF